MSISTAKFWETSLSLTYLKNSDSICCNFSALAWFRSSAVIALSFFFSTSSSDPDCGLSFFVFTLCFWQYDCKFLQIFYTHVTSHFGLFWFGKVNLRWKDFFLHTLSLIPSSAFSSTMIGFISSPFLNAQVTWYAVLHVFTEHWMHAPVFSLQRTHTSDHRLCCNSN